jgi:hypothetical protein
MTSYLTFLTSNSAARQTWQHRWRNAIVAACMRYQRSTSTHDGFTIPGANMEISRPAHRTETIKNLNLFKYNLI